MNGHPQAVPAASWRRALSTDAGQALVMVGGIVVVAGAYAGFLALVAWLVSGRWMW